MSTCKQGTSDSVSVIVLDFETTGLSPKYGDRAIEIGAVLIENNRVTDRFQSLMNPGFRINSFIESYTGISNDMVKDAPPCAKVMKQFAKFLGDHPFVAHNASFDRKFLDAELSCIGKTHNNRMACSMLLARRIYPNAPNHKLGTLVRYCNIPTDGTFHRALADAEMTGHLWLSMIETIREVFDLNQVSFGLMQRLSKIAKARAPEYLAKVARKKH
ncbi:MAG: 3'-5' exonuclease [Deltaproteobacteria bacterium]|nr:3'-5' exonuclease [Candidatus Tharpellaceae bacterium]